MQNDEVSFAAKNNYSFFKSIFLRKTYPRAKNIDSMIPINERAYKRKLLKKISTIKKKERMHKSIKSIWIENFIIFSAYAGMAFSFQ
tara:strand:+ start:399 stop:659 length:261 start_codon:yes stop_codon:yes gene_type:complete